MSPLEGDVITKYECCLQIAKPLPQIEWTDEKGGKRKMRRIKKIIFTGLLAGALTFPVVLCPGQEKKENASKKETSKKSMSESAKGKVRQEWQNIKKDSKEAGQEVKESSKSFTDSAKKESKKIGEALRKAGKQIKQGLHETFKGLKKLFKE
jgi:hypothetical protein